MHLHIATGIIPDEQHSLTSHHTLLDAFSLYTSAWRRFPFTGGFSVPLYLW